MKFEIRVEIAPGLFEHVTFLECGNVEELWAKIDSSVVPKLLESGSNARNIYASLNHHTVSMDWLEDLGPSSS